MCIRDRRNSSGIASELGSMKVTEQIDAMRALGTDPIQKLVTPRLVATCFMLPLLTVIADFVGLFGGWVIAIVKLHLTSRLYWTCLLYTSRKLLHSGHVAKRESGGHLHLAEFPSDKTARKALHHLARLRILLQ